MNWMYYLLEANLYLILFYGFYRLFLHKETFYALNRYYLILSSLTAFLIPFLQLGILSKEIILSDEPVYQQIKVKEPLFSTENILLCIYVLIAFIFISKIIWGFRYIIKLLKKPNKTIENGITIVELVNTKTAFSFFNILFIDPELPQKNTILRHEMVHIKQKHSFDILFFELIRGLNWFNPITHFLKSDIKLLHEYLADEETTNKGIEKYEYALLLIQNSYGDKSIHLTNQIFNSSILKRRISMLNQKKSAKWARLRLLLVLPAIGGMLCTSTMAFTKDYGVVDLYPKKEKTIKIFIQEPANKKVTRKTVAPPPPPVEPQAAKKDLTERVVKGYPAKGSSTKAQASKSDLKTVIVKGYKVEDKKIAPPPPPVEPPAEKKDLTERVVKGYPLKNVQIKAQTPKSQSELTPLKVKGYKISDKNATPPPPLVEPAAKKNYDKDDVIYGDPTPSIAENMLIF